MSFLTCFFVLSKATAISLYLTLKTYILQVLMLFILAVAWTFFEVKHLMEKMYTGAKHSLLNLLGLNYITDVIVLSSGYHDIQIDLPGEPKKVWFCLEDQCGVAICHGDIDSVGIELGDYFFTMYADIYSDVRVIRWFAILK